MMKSACFRELEPLTIDEISRELGMSIEETQRLIDSVKYHNRKVVKAYADLNEDVARQDDIKCIPKKKAKYAFQFVGVIVYDDVVIKCMPKYLVGCYSNRQQDKILKTIMKVFKEYGSDKESLEELDLFDDENPASLLSIIVYVLTNYMENGLYYNQKDVFETNGEGEIEWDKTISESDAFIVNKKPYYFDLVTYGNVDNDNDYFRQLHRHVINKCSEELINAGLENLLSLPAIEFDVDDSLFLDDGYIINRIYQELSVQFVVKKQILLKMMLMFFERKRISGIDAEVLLYGSMDFQWVWEDVCAFVLDNKYKLTMEKINELDQSIVTTKYSPKGKTKRLMDIIPHPNWFYEKYSPVLVYSKKHQATKTIKLDLISIFTKDSEKYFVIWDAKYYNLILEDTKKLAGIPGVQDIIKQYVYGLIYKDFIKEHNFDKSYNILLFPSEDSNIEFIGRADFEIVKNAMTVDDIHVVKLPAEMMYELYIKHKHLNIAKNFVFPI